MSATSSFDFAAATVSAVHSGTQSASSGAFTQNTEKRRPLFASAPRLTLKAILDHLTPPREDRVAPPRIRISSDHYQFALLVLAGFPYQEACDELGFKTRTAEDWRSNFCAEAAEYYGRRVTYEFAIREALKDQWDEVVRVEGGPRRAS